MKSCSLDHVSYSNNDLTQSHSFSTLRNLWKVFGKHSSQHFSADYKATFPQEIKQQFLTLSDFQSVDNLFQLLRGPVIITTIKAQQHKVFLLICHRTLLWGMYRMLNSNMCYVFTDKYRLVEMYQCMQIVRQSSWSSDDAKPCSVRYSNISNICRHVFKTLLYEIQRNIKAISEMLQTLNSMDLIITKNTVCCSVWSVCC